MIVLGNLHIIEHIQASFLMWAPGTLKGIQMARCFFITMVANKILFGVMIVFDHLHILKNINPT